MKFQKYLILLIILFVFISSCTTAPSQTQAPSKEPSDNQSLDENQKCAQYIRNNIKENYCATCGNNICEPFETCVPSICDEEGCTEDCGLLECPDDCKEREEQTYPSVVPKLPEISGALRTCNLDSDCVIIKSDCCGCTAGGTADTIHKKYKEQWENTVQSKCENIACTAVMSNDWSCFAEAKCVRNKCAMVRQAE